MYVCIMEKHMEIVYMHIFLKHVYYVRVKTMDF